ncbi:MAG: DUF4238 domain-containing protein [Acidobacteria bacterium]|nr:DUF4238 domain-containing protein [Acidobacteriota bacterium]
MATARRHHVLPSFYLDGFRHDGALWAHDLETGGTFQVSPRNAAVRRDFYAIDADVEGGDHPEGAELVLGAIESAAAPVIARARRGEVITAREGHELRAFIATLLVRTPAARGMFTFNLLPRATFLDGSPLSCRAKEALLVSGDPGLIVNGSPCFET